MREAISGYALYVFSPGTDGKKFELPFPGLFGQIDSAMAGAESRPPRREKNGGKAWLAKARFFSRPSSDPEVSFLQTLSVKNDFAYVVGYGRGKTRFLHTLSVTDGEIFKVPRHSESAERKLCIFPITDGGKHQFCTRYRLRRGKSNACGWYFFWRSLLLVRVRPPSSKIGPKQICDGKLSTCLLYTSPSPRDGLLSRMPSSA